MFPLQLFSLKIRFSIKIPSQMMLQQSSITLALPMTILDFQTSDVFLGNTIHPHSYLLSSNPRQDQQKHYKGAVKHSVHL